MFRVTYPPFFFVWLLSLPQNILAAAAKRQDSTASIAPNTPSTTLQPVPPPDNNPDDFSILLPDLNLNLYYGGAPESNVYKRAEADSAILVNVDFKFLHPSVHEDYTSYISGVSCSGENTLTGLFNSLAAYTVAKAAWSSLDSILLITPAGGCGGDGQNDVFLANSISFFEDDLSFTATGAEYLVRDVAEKSDITARGVKHVKCL